MSTTTSFLDRAASPNGLREVTEKMIVVAPLLIVFLCTCLMAIPQTREAARWLLQENGPIELLTFGVLLVAGIHGLSFASRTRKAGASGFIPSFYLMFSIGLLLTAMEEIAWGQWFFHFDTPQVIRNINLQNELTLHNIQGMHGHSEYLRLAFGVGGLVGVYLSRFQGFQKVAASPILLSWFLTIVVLASVDAFNDYVSIQSDLDRAITKLSEVVELLVAMAGFLFLWLNERRMSSELDGKRRKK